jgi:hypothetical protein
MIGLRLWRRVYHSVFWIAPTTAAACGVVRIVSACCFELLPSAVFRIILVRIIFESGYTA